MLSWAQGGLSVAVVAFIFVRYGAGAGIAALVAVTLMAKSLLTAMRH